MEVENERNGFIMTKNIYMTVTSNNVNEESLSDDAMEILMKMLYRLYSESVVNHGHTEHAA